MVSHHQTWIAVVQCNNPLFSSLNIATEVILPAWLPDQVRVPVMLMNDRISI